MTFRLLPCCCARAPFRVAAGAVALLLAGPVNGAPEETARSVRGIEIVREATLIHQGQPWRTARTGELFKFLGEADGVVTVLSYDLHGRPIVLSVAKQATVPVDSLVQKHLDQTAFHVWKGDYAAALTAIEGALRAGPPDLYCAHLKDRIARVASLTIELSAVRAAHLINMQGVSQLLRNAAITDRPNPLSPKDTSYRERAGRMRGDASAAEAQSMENIQAVAAKLDAAKAELNELLKGRPARD